MANADVSVYAVKADGTADTSAALAKTTTDANGALQQPDSQLLLECPDEAGHCGSREAKASRGRSKCPQLGDGDKG